MAETQFRIWGWPKVGTGSADMAVSYHITRAEAHAELARVSERFPRWDFLVEEVEMV